MHACLVNVSSPRYNLGLAKYRAYLVERGWQVEVAAEPPRPLFAAGYDLVAFSAIFSWDVPALIAGVRQIAARAPVEIGGPGTFVLALHIERETGVTPARGLDPRFERARPLPGESYEQTFSSRGCPAGCGFCIVPRLEGRQVVAYPDFAPAPEVLDNNVLAAPVAHQERVVERLLAQGYKQVDFKSGFEAARLDQAAFERFNRLPLKPWRLAFDETRDAPAVERAMRLLRENGIRGRRLGVYVLFGNEPPGACHERAQKVIAWGGEPFVQPLMALDALEKRPVARHGWTRQDLIDASRYYNRWIWRKTPWAEYDRHFRAGRRPQGEDDKERSGNGGRAGKKEDGPAVRQMTLHGGTVRQE